MKRIAVFLALILPALGLGLWFAFPQADVALAAPLFHFYIVTFTTFAATVLSLFVSISVGHIALPRHLLLAIAFAWMGAVFFIHGATTTGVLIQHFHPGIVWSAWLTLFGGGVLFLLGAFAPNAPDPRFLRGVAVTILIVYLLYAAAVVLLPDVLSQLLRLQRPPLDVLVFGLTLIIWLASSLGHYRSYGRTRNFLDGLMAFESVWYATATVSMFQFPLFNASWWLYHALLLVGFLIAIYALWRAYEQIRAFRLTRYYAAASLIVTAALALLSAQVYSQQVYEHRLDQLRGDSRTLGLNLAAELAAALPGVATADDLRQLGDVPDLRAALRGRLAGLPIQALSLYDADGAIVFSTVEEWIGLRASPTEADFRAALAGELTLELYEPGTSPGLYAPANPVHVLEARVPFRPGGGAPMGVLEIVREAPELAQALVLARRAGLGLAALSLGGLFLALLVIVRRADQIIASRTRELERAYAGLQQAEGLRDDLTNMIVHDLRNPLTAITANLDLLGKALNNPSNPDAPPRFLASARASGQRMMGMIDDLLNVSKFEAGELRPALEPVYLPTLLIEKEESYRSQAKREGKTLTLKVNAPAQQCTIPGDAGLLGRVVDNLLSNAFKYTEPGGQIELSLDGDDHHLVVRVRDDGQGIPPDYHTRIFEKFVQVKNPDGVAIRKGTGLGLAFCRLAVEAHGGKIWVESVPGQGSTFSFTLPLGQR
jgi:signal transduction histidine kinase